MSDLRSMGHAHSHLVDLLVSAVGTQTPDCTGVSLVYVHVCVYVCMCVCVCVCVCVCLHECGHECVCAFAHLTSRTYICKDLYSYGGLPHMHKKSHKCKIELLLPTAW